MEEDTDCIPQIVNITKNEYPLLTLVKSVINLMNNDKEHMVLTNLQLMNILKVEFNIDVRNQSELESEVYLNVLKYFLKTWPCWDQLYEAVQKCSKKNTDEFLKTQCEYLKKYLNETLSTAENTLQPYQKMLQNHCIASRKTDNSEEVVMKINCTRGQLNQLIFRRPHPSNGTIFNITEAPIPKKISTEQYNLQQIVNSPNVQMHFYFPGFECCRTNTTTIERQIVNMKRSQHNLNNPQPLNQGLYLKKSVNNKIANVDKDTIVSFMKELDKMATIRMTNSAIRPIFKLFVSEFSRDFEKLPSVVTGGEYRFHFHKYKYVRRLVVEPDNEEKDVEIEGINRNNYDLQLEEILTPKVDFQITKLCPSTMKINEKSVVFMTGCWAKVECLPCKKKFEIRSNLTELLQHFEDHHEIEPFWICTGCQNKFSVKHLSSNRWTHDCVDNS